MEIANNKVTVFGLTKCPYCKAVKKYLKENETPYDYIVVDDLSDDDYAAAMEVVVKYNPRKSFPTIVFGETGQYVIGLEKPKIDAAIEEMRHKGLLS